jgi:hypothetical protein
MEDSELLPCPWCRNADVEAAWEGEADAWFYYVLCGSCGMSGPPKMTVDDAREAYMVVARLVDTVLEALYKDVSIQTARLVSAAQTFDAERKHHANR